MKRVPALVVAGVQSGSGKTTIATALMAAFTCRGKRVQPFKIGPDFIDPSYHSAATGRPSRNLDGWMLSRAANLEIFADATSDADIAVIEGVMGLFDGNDGTTESGSTAEMARWLGIPVLLVVDASALARSAAAIVRGFEDFDPRVELLGVIFNRVSGDGHYRFLRSAVGAHCRTRPLGYLVPDTEISLPDRHLGLVMAEEVPTADRIDRLVGWIEAGLDLNSLWEALWTAGPAEIDTEPAGRPTFSQSRVSARPRIGVARDRAFCFYYQENLDLLARCGGDLVYFSPIADPHLPDQLDGIYLGGGYPELHAGALAKNKTMREDIARFARSGLPVYAECGGLMFLTEEIVDVEGRGHAMTGIFPARTRMLPRLAAIGYAEVEAVTDSGWLRVGERARGHEFRYSVIEDMPASIARLYHVTRGGRLFEEGFSVGSVLGSYVHLHFASCPSFPARFVAAAATTKTAADKLW